MKNQIAIIVNKSCDICIDCNISDYTDQLLCLRTMEQVDDDFVCKDFRVCKEVLSDTFFKIKEIKDLNESI